MNVLVQKEGTYLWFYDFDFFLISSGISIDSVAEQTTKTSFGKYLFHLKERKAWRRHQHSCNHIVSIDEKLTFLILYCAFFYHIVLHLLLFNIVFFFYIFDDFNETLGCVFIPLRFWQFPRQSLCIMQIHIIIFKNLFYLLE